MLEFIKHGVLKRLASLLDHRRPGVRRETLWVISNIVAEDENMLAKVLETNIMPKIIHALSFDIEDVRHEACICCINALYSCTWEQAETIMNLDLIKACTSAISSPNPKVVLRTIELIGWILQKGEIIAEKYDNEQNYFLLETEQVGLVKQIESLQNHPDEKVYERIVALIDRYYTTQDK